MINLFDAALISYSYVCSNAQDEICMACVKSYTLLYLNVNDIVAATIFNVI